MACTDFGSFLSHLEASRKLAFSAYSFTSVHNGKSRLVRYTVDSKGDELNVIIDTISICQTRYKARTSREKWSREQFVRELGTMKNVFFDPATAMRYNIAQDYNMVISELSLVDVRLLTLL